MSKGWAGGMAWVACPPFWWWCVQGACTIPCFCSLTFRSNIWAFFFFFFLISVSGHPEFAPTNTNTELFLVPYNFFVVRGDLVQVLQQRVPGPRGFQREGRGFQKTSAVGASGSRHEDGHLRGCGMALHFSLSASPLPLNEKKS